MPPEITFWSNLVKDGTLCLKQRIPEVAVVDHGRITSWLYSTPRGLLMARPGPASFDAVLARFMNVASKRIQGTVQASTPVAILRRLSQGLIEQRNVPQDAPAQVFVAIVLSAGELTALIGRLKRGLDNSEVFSLQSIVQPADDVRIISVYSCDGLGEEMSDIFGRPFEPMYPLHTSTVSIPSAEEVADDRCASIPPQRYAAVESKTLSVVRYVSRFHKKPLNGLICEFVVDQQEHLVLHGFWSCSFFAAGAMDPSSFMSPRACTPVQTSVRETPPTYPVYSGSPRQARRRGPFDDRSETPEWSRGVEDEVDALTDALDPGSLSRASSAASCRDAIPADVLAEVWTGSVCLGGVWFPALDSVEPRREFALPLRQVEEWQPRAQHCRHAEQVGGTLHFAAEWRYRPGEDRGCLQLTIERAAGLLLPAGERTLNPQVRLWLRRPLGTYLPGEARDQTFVPLYVSKEVANAASPAFAENCGGLWIPCFLPQAPRAPVGPKPRGKARPDAAARPTASRPASASRKRSPASGSRAASPQLARGQKQVGGAAIDSHWGMTKDGTFSTHVLAKQVLSRFGTERQTRGVMLGVLARQCERFRELHLAWQEQRSAARMVVDRVENEVVEREEKLAAELEVKEQEVEKYRARLGAVYRGMQQEIDALKRVDSERDGAYQESLGRERAQTAMIESLESRNKALRLTLDKTMAKLDDLQQQRGGAPERERLASPALVPGAPAHGAGPELSSALQQIAMLATSRDRSEEDLGFAKASILRLQDEVSREREIGRLLRQFVQRVALGPEAAARRGGGYAVDAQAKNDAVGLLDRVAVLARRNAVGESSDLATLYSVDRDLQDLQSLGSRAEPSVGAR